MKDDLNGRRPQWKTTSMEDDHNGRRPQWKTTTMEDDHNGRRAQWKIISMEDNIKEALQGADGISLIAIFVLSLAQLSPAASFHIFLACIE